MTQEAALRRRPTGTVKWFAPELGYGYIAPDEGGEELCFGYSATWGGDIENLDVGRRVRYEAVEGWNGPRAERVSRL